MSFFVDLTLSDDEAPAPAPRSNTAARAPSPDSDVIIVDEDAGRGHLPPPRAPGQGQQQRQGGMGDDDLLITGEAGIDSRRDLPHTRDQCGNHAFHKSCTLGNALFCRQCYCFVCDVKAGQCEFWGTGVLDSHHCNAHHTGAYDQLRATWRRGDKAYVRRCFQEQKLPTVVTVTEGGDAPAAAAAGAGGGGGSSRGRGGSGIGGTSGGSGGGGAGGAALIGVRPPSHPFVTGASPWGMSKSQRKKLHKAQKQALLNQLDTAARGLQAAQPLQHQQQQQQQQQQQKSGPAPSKFLQQMPDPALNKDLMHIGQLKLPVTCVKGTTIQALQRRIVRYGYYHNPALASLASSAKYGDRLCIDNIAERAFDQSKGSIKPVALKLLTLPAPPGEMAPPDPRRVRAVTVVHHDGAAAPTTYGVKVDKEARAEELVEGVQRLLGSALKPDETLRLCKVPNDISQRSWSTHFSFLDTSEPGKSAMLDDSSFKTYRFYAFRVPKPPPGEDPAKTQVYGVAHAQPQYVMLLFERAKTQGKPRKPPTDDDDDCCKKPRGSNVGEPGGAFGIGSGSDSYGLGGGSSDDSEDPLAGLHYAPRQQEYERFGVPLLVDFPCALSDKGPEAEAHLRKRLDAAMKPFFSGSLGLAAMPSLKLFLSPAREYYGIGDASHGPSDEVGHGLSKPGTHHTMPGRSLKSAFDSLPPLASRTPGGGGGGGGGPSCRGGVAAVYCFTGSREMPQTFDAAAFATPRAHESAAPEVLAATQKLMDQQDAYRQRMALLASLPAKVLDELRAACRASPPEPQAPGVKPKLASSLQPRAAVALRLVPDDEAAAVAAPPGAGAAAAAPQAGPGGDRGTKGATGGSGSSKSGKEGRRGHMLVDVWIWKAPGAARSVVLEQFDSWFYESAGRGRMRRDMPCALRNTFDMLTLTSGPEGYSMLQDLRDLSLKEGKASSLKGLMETVVAGERPAAPQPPGLAVSLHPYQRQSLQFMLDCERKEGGYRGHFWRRLPADHARGSLWYSPVFHRASLNVPPMPAGGFLCEEMGLGKTIEVLGLILSAPAGPRVVSGRVLPSGKIETRATLVVCAVSLVGQWCAEAESKLQGRALRMHQYHGSNRCKDPSRLAQYDLVVTTYETLQSDNSGRGIRGGATGSGAPCNQIKWHRIVFDEGHKVKAPKTGMAKACVELQSQLRWVCTGTPINNSIEDLLGQFGVLDMKPLSIKGFFDAQVKAAYTAAYHVDKPRLVTLLYVLNRTLIRHTKRQIIAGVQVLDLPPKTEELVPVPLTASERSLYLETHSKAARLWHSVRGMSPAYINKRLLQIMALLNPLRRICGGGPLSEGELALPEHLEAEMAPFSLPVLGAAALAAAAGPVREDASLAAPTEAECSICLDAFEAPVATPCSHWFCRECILSVLVTSSHCPLCRRGVDEASLRAPTAAALARGAGGGAAGGSGGCGGSGREEGSDGGGGGGGGGGGPVVVESKLRALLRELRAMRRADPTSKALVFSQYTSTLEWVKQHLVREGVSCHTITGSMAQKQRAKAIDAFQRNPSSSVFLLSVRSGAVGINLTAANYVFVLEPCINPALEEQAIGRAWRMGQQRPVVVKKFYVKGSIEERIMEVRKQRQEARAGHHGQQQQQQGGDAAANGAAAAGGTAAGQAGAGAGPSGQAAAAGASTSAPPPQQVPQVEEEEEAEDGQLGGRSQKVKAGVLAGNLKADRQVLKVAELDLLFQEPKLDKAEDHPDPQDGGEEDDEGGEEEDSLELPPPPPRRPRGRPRGGGRGAAAAVAAGGGRGRGRPRRGGSSSASMTSYQAEAEDGDLDFVDLEEDEEDEEEEEAGTFGAGAAAAGWGEYTGKRRRRAAAAPRRPYAEESEDDDDEEIWAAIPRHTRGGREDKKEGSPEGAGGGGPHPDGLRRGDQGGGGGEGEGGSGAELTEPAAAVGGRSKRRRVASSRYGDEFELLPVDDKVPVPALAGVLGGVGTGGAAATRAATSAGAAAAAEPRRGRGRPRKRPLPESDDEFMPVAADEEEEEATTEGTEARSEEVWRSSGGGSDE